MNDDAPRPRRRRSLTAGFGDSPDPQPRSARQPKPVIAGSVADMEGRWLLNLDVAATVLLAAITAHAGIIGGDGGQIANLAGSGILFCGSCVLFAIGFFRAAARSRDDDVHLAGLYYLSDVAPRTVRRTFMGLWFIQIALGVVNIMVASPPFGVMATVFGVSANSAWSARYGNFDAHERRR